MFNILVMSFQPLPLHLLITREIRKYSPPRCIAETTKALLYTAQFSQQLVSTSS